MKNSKNRKLMKLLSFILCIALVLSGNSWSGLTAVRAAETGNETGTDSTIDTGSRAVYYGNGYSVTIEVTAKWNSGFNANVTIENTSNEEIRNWELIMTGADSISNIWNAKKLSQEDGSLKIGNDGWNQDIAAGSSVNFGFQSLTDSAAMPVECYLAGDRQDAEEEDYRIVFRAINTWEGGCVVETDILNLTDKDIEDWDVAFTWKDIRIADIWNAVIDTDSDGSYTITNDTYNSIVPANGKVTFGMRLDTGTGELIFPSDAKLSRWTGDSYASDDENKTDDKTDDKTEDPANEELRRWNRTMMNMDADSVQEAVEHVDERIKVAILDSGVDAMPEIPVVERFNLIDGEDEMTEMFEDATGHGTAVASVMAYHREKEEENGNTYEYFTEDIEDIDEYFDFEDEEDSETEDGEDTTDDTDWIDSEWEEDDDEEDGEVPEGTIRLGEFVEEHQADFEGINPNMELYSVRLLDEMNEATVSDVIKGIRWAMKNDIKIINISFGTQTDSPELYKVIKEAEKRGMLIIAAAGNNGEVQYPAAYDEVIAVGSVDYTGKVESECEKDTYIELTAPGEGVLAVGPFGVETEACGTSIAAGEVSAVASILWQHDPTVSNRFIRQLLRAGANRSDNTAMGYGIVDCEYSLSIFEDLKETFVDNEDAATDELMEEAGIEENTDELVTEGIVTANWGGKGHIDLVTGSSISVVDDYLKVLVIGARLPDSALCNLNDKEKFPAWHGCYYTTKLNNKKEKEKIISPTSNYVAGYLYLSRLARKINNGGGYSLAGNGDLKTIFNNLKMRDKISSEGINVGGKILERNIKRDKNGIIITPPESNWDNILKSKLYDESVKAKDIVQLDKTFSKVSEEKKKLYKSLVVYGMSLHTMTDTFAHSSWGYGNKVKKWQWGMPGDVTDKDKANDNKNIIPLRYEAARQAVLNSMDNIWITPEKKLIIIQSTTLDFCSRAYKDENSATKKGNDEWDYKKYIHKIDGKPIAIEMEYFEKGFGIKNIWKFAKKCEENPNKYLKRIDKDRIASVSSIFGVVEYDKDVNGPVKVSLINGKNEQELFSTTASISAGTLNLALNKDFNEGEYYTIEKQTPGDYGEIIIDSRTLFKAPEKTDDETIVGLMVVWDTGERTQNGPIRIVLTWKGDLNYIIPLTHGVYDYFHVCSIHQKFENSKGDLIAKCETDKDSASETITVYDPNISFRYLVDYSIYDSSRTTLSKSEAKVQVYKGNSLIDTYYMPWKYGRRWTVFSYDGKTGVITPIGEID